ncbi:TPA: replicative DNA helicase, partial [Acinetobacter baumannii]|nr:replicative DNA helicase [Acinetobacter baumannii]
MIELYSIPVEQYVLSAFMSFNQGMDDFIEQLEAEDFYASQHQVIFKHIHAQYLIGEAFDEITIWQQIRANANESRVIDESFIVNLMSRVPQVSILGTHVKTLKDLSARRKLNEIGKAITTLSIDMVGHSSDSAINKAQSLLQNMSHSASDDYLKHAHEFTKEAIG